jgi:hypothetical protein
MDFGSISILSGMALAALAQVSGAIAVFGTSPLHGVFTLIIPGYLWVAIRKTPYYWKIIGSWLAGISLLVLGVVLKS